MFATLSTDWFLPPERESEEWQILSEAEYKRPLGRLPHFVVDGATIELLLQSGSQFELSNAILPTRFTRGTANVASLRVQV